MAPSWDRMGRRGSGTKTDPGVTDLLVAVVYEVMAAATAAGHGDDIRTVWAAPPDAAMWGRKTWNGSPVEHGRGKAADFMCDTKAAGDWVTNYLRENAHRLPLDGLVYWTQCMGFPVDGEKDHVWAGPWGAWRPYGGSNPHKDHVHLCVLEGRTYVPPAPPPIDPPFVWDGKTFPGAGRFAIGTRGEWVTKLGQMLVAAGYTGYQVGPGPVMGTADVAGVKWFQEQQGWTGTDADGIPGPETWRRLTTPDEPPPPPNPTRRVQVIKGGVIDTPFGRKGSSWRAGYHPGDDWNDPKQRDAATIHSAVTGKVVDVGATSWGSAFGNVVTVQDSTGDRTAHCHLQSWSVKIGDRVTAGQPIGIEGSTGNVTGPHCHVERRHKPYGYWDHERPVYDPI